MQRVSLPIAKGNARQTHIHMSHSSISLFQRCGLRYYFRHVAGLAESTVTASLLLGAGFHAAVELHFRRLLIGNQPPKLDALLDVFWTTWHDNRGSRLVHFATGEGIKTIGRLADRMLRVFQTSPFARPKGAIVGVGEERCGPIVAGLPDLLARVDLMIDEADAFVLTDFRTARSAWDEAQASDALGQLVLYHELAKPLADDKPVRLRLAVLTKNKVPHLVVQDFPVDPHQIERSKRIAERVWRTIQAENFFPSPSAINCHSCPYREPCRAWKG